MSVRGYPVVDVNDTPPENYTGPWDCVTITWYPDEARSIDLHTRYQGVELTTEAARSLHQQLGDVLAQEGDQHE